MGRQGKEILALVFTEGTRTHPRHSQHPPTPNTSHFDFWVCGDIRNSLEKGSTNENRPVVAKSVCHLLQQASYIFLKENTTARVILAASCHPHCIPGSYLCDFQDDFKLCSEFILSVIVKVQLGQSACPPSRSAKTPTTVFSQCAARYQKRELREDSKIGRAHV